MSNIKNNDKEIATWLFSIGIGYRTKKKGKLQQKWGSIISKNFIHMWWEDSEKWFLNISEYHGTTKTFDTPSWIIRSDALNHIKFMLRNNYKIIN